LDGPTLVPDVRRAMGLGTTMAATRNTSIAPSAA
jgi:hypothetical protein